MKKNLLFAIALSTAGLTYNNAVAMQQKKEYVENCLKGLDAYIRHCSTDKYFNMLKNDPKHYPLFIWTNKDQREWSCSNHKYFEFFKQQDIAKKLADSITSIDGIMANWDLGAMDDDTLAAWREAVDKYASSK